MHNALSVEYGNIQVSACLFAVAKSLAFLLVQKTNTDTQWSVACRTASWAEVALFNTSAGPKPRASRFKLAASHWEVRPDVITDVQRVRMSDHVTQGGLLWGTIWVQCLGHKILPSEASASLKLSSLSHYITLQLMQTNYPVKATPPPSPITFWETINGREVFP